MRRRYAILGHDRLLRLAEHMNVELIMTHHNEFVEVDAGDSVATAKTRMGKNYDQLPVRRGDSYVGLIRMSNLADARDEDLIQCWLSPIGKGITVDARASIHDVIQELSTSPALLVFDTRACVGLVHFTDLNKQGVRVFVYLWLSAVEMALAGLLRLGDHRKWLGLLGSRKAIYFRGKLEEDRKAGIAPSSPVEYLNLSELVRVIQKMPHLLDRLRLSRRALGESGGAAVELRQKIMHPSRTLIKCQEEVKQLVGRLSDLCKLVAATRGQHNAQVRNGSAETRPG